MAPEQALGKQVRSHFSPRVDIYALVGRTLYEMLTGRPRFGRQAPQKLNGKSYQWTRLPSQLNVNVPHDLETICLKCLNKDPSRRYATAALAEDLPALSSRADGTARRVLSNVSQMDQATAIVGGTNRRQCSVYCRCDCGGMLWIAVQQTNRRHAIEADLREMSQLQHQARWVDAHVALERERKRS